MPNMISEAQIEQALVQKLQHLHGFDSQLKVALRVRAVVT